MACSAIPPNQKNIWNGVSHSSSFSSSGRAGGYNYEDSKEDDLLELLILSNKNLKKDGIKMIFRKHPIVEAEPGVKDLIGYFPTGEFQIIFEKDKRRISCIRGWASGGLYEVWGVAGINTGDAERFSDPRAVVKWIKDKLK